MIILHVIIGLENGGAEGVLSRLVAASKYSVDQHHVVSLMGRGIYAEQIEENGGIVYTLDFGRGKVTVSGVLKLFSILRKVKPDVVQTWLYHADLLGGLLARLLGIRSIVWGIRHANFDPQYNSRGTLKVMRLCSMLSDYIPRKIVSCSMQATQLHQQAGYISHKFVLIPNGYDMNRFKPDDDSRNAFRADLGIAHKAFVLGMVARFNVQKNHRNLIQALGELKRNGVQFTCLLVGVDIEEGNGVLREWMEDAGVVENVKLLGPRSDIPAVMNALDIHVLSSLGEAFPNVLAEAMACGTPCVTTDVGDAAVIVSNHGWIVSPQNTRALTDGLMQAYDRFKSNGVEWQQRKRACRTHIMANFELKKMSEKYRQVWKESMRNQACSL